jgi:hypothetical protein
MHRSLLVSATLFLSTFVGGCSADETREPPASNQAAISETSSQVAVSDDEIDSYIAWWRAQLDLDRRQLGEMNELQGRLDSKFLDLNKVQEDPELLAMMARHREELMEHKRNSPISPEKMDGLDSVLAGLGRTVNRDGRTAYEIHHDESALRGARGEYGDEFVDKVLSREGDIAAGMNP